MKKETIAYEDYNGEKVVEDFWFGLSKTELLKLNNEFGGNLQNYYEDMMNKRDVAALSKFFDKLIYMSYGEKTPDGRHFIKKDVDGHDLAIMFTQTPAYDNLYLSLMEDLNKAALFIIGILPGDMSAAAQEEYNKLVKDGTIPANNNVIDMPSATDA